MSQILPVVILLGGLIFVHELGHFLVAKAFRVKVLRFSLGFGPKLIGFRRGETEYRISILPLGGYVKMAGDDPTQPLEAADRGRGYLEQAPWKRILIALAGPGFNLIFPVLAYFLLFVLPTQAVAPHVGQVVPGMPAAEAGIRPGDRIVEVSGEPIYAFVDLRRHIDPAPGKPLEVVVERDGQRVTYTVTPQAFPEEDPIETVVVGKIGVSPNPAAPEVAFSAQDGMAREAGLRSFDRVEAVGGAPVATLEEALAAFDRHAAGSQPYEVRVRRGANAAGEGGEAVVLQVQPGPHGLESSELYVREVKEGSAAAKAGLLRGDRIVSMDGKVLRTWQELEQARREKAAAPFELVLLRDGEERRIRMAQDVSSQMDEIRGRQIEIYTFGASGGLPVLAAPVTDVPFRPFVAAQMALSSTWEVSRKIALGIGKLFTGGIALRNVGGPIQIYDVATKAAQQGWEHFLHTMAMISINLGLLNLLPVPVLDGGHIVQASVEAVRRKPLTIRTREIANLVGIAMLLALMIYALKNDVVRYFLAG